MMQSLARKGLHLYHLKEILARRWRNNKSQERNEDLDEEMKYSRGEMKTSYTTNRENDNSHSNSSRNGVHMTQHGGNDLYKVGNGDLTHTHPSDTPLINIGGALTRNDMKMNIWADTCQLGLSNVFGP